MGERYWISGVQLGMLIALTNQVDRSSMVDQIVDLQFLGDKDDPKLKGLFGDGK